MWADMPANGERAMMNTKKKNGYETTDEKKENKDSTRAGTKEDRRASTGWFRKASIDVAFNHLNTACRTHTVTNFSLTKHPHHLHTSVASISIGTTRQSPLPSPRVYIYFIRWTAVWCYCVDNRHPPTVPKKKYRFRAQNGNVVGILGTNNHFSSIFSFSFDADTQTTAKWA